MKMQFRINLTFPNHNLQINNQQKILHVTNQQNFTNIEVSIQKEKLNKKPKEQFQLRNQSVQPYVKTSILPLKNTSLSLQKSQFQQQDNQFKQQQIQQSKKQLGQIVMKCQQQNSIIVEFENETSQQQQKKLLELKQNSISSAKLVDKSIIKQDETQNSGSYQYKQPQQQIQQKKQKQPWQEQQCKLNESQNNFNQEQYLQQKSESPNRLIQKTEKNQNNSQSSRINKQSFKLCPQVTDKNIEQQQLKSTSFQQQQQQEVQESQQLELLTKGKGEQVQFNKNVNSKVNSDDKIEKLEKQQLSQNLQQQPQIDKIKINQSEKCRDYKNQLNQLVFNIPDIQKCQIDSNCEFIWIKTSNYLNYYCPMCDGWGEELQEYE